MESESALGKEETKDRNTPGLPQTARVRCPSSYRRAPAICVPARSLLVLGDFQQQVLSSFERRCDLQSVECLTFRFCVLASSQVRFGELDVRLRAVGRIGPAAV